VVVKLPLLCVLLIHLGACAEPVAWAARRPISEATLLACPDPEWRSWIAGALKVSPSAPWVTWEAAAKRAISGSGYGSGDGYGDGYGDGDGSGSGYGDGDGSGYGSGDGSGSGYGYGYGYGDGSGSGYGYGSGSGYGYGSGVRDIVSSKASGEA
jgi:hypothetical protein